MRVRDRFQGHAVAERICETCGFSFIARVEKPGRYCSNRCRARAPRWRECRDCGGEWLAPRGCNSARCEPCREAAVEVAKEKARVAARDRYTSKATSYTRTADCARCGVRFTGHGGRIYCSKRCSHSALKELREARKRSLTVQPFVRRHIYERDGWRCGICGRALDRGARVPNPMAPTIDHIVPLSLGGSHTPANVRAAHFMCNSRRSNRGAAQMRLLA